MNYNILPTIRKDKKDADGLVPVYIFIYDVNLKAKISLGHKVNILDWNEKERRVRKQADCATLINSLIEKKVVELRTKIITEQLLNPDKPIDLSSLIKNEKIKDANFYEFAERQIIQKNYAEETRRAYRIYIDKLKEYKKTLRLSEINFEFLQGYEAYLRETLKNGHNTIWGNFKFINTITNDAIKMKFLVEDPFKNFKRVKYKQPERTYLDAVELERMEAFINRANDKGLTLVGKYFLFMAFTGLRWSDAIRFNSMLHVIKGERIVITTQKTGKITNLLINDRIRPLVAFVDANPYLTNGKPVLTQVDFNRKLKVIAAGAGVHKKVSSHVARHSFGSSLADLGVSMEVAKGLLSHGSSSSTKIYYHVKSTNLDDAMRKFNKE